MVNVLEYLYSAQETQGAKIAFVDEHQELSYDELARQVRCAGSALTQRIGTRRAPVVVFVDRNVQSICGLLGVVASGNFYVPIDSTQPAERMHAILNQMQPVAIVDAAGAHDAAVLDGFEIPLFSYGELIEGEADDALLDDIMRSSLDTDPLFAICTSGSTGVPKGVVKSHRSVLEFIPRFAKTFAFDDSERFANQAPFDFDVSTKDIYTTLYCAASTYIVPKKCFALPKLLAQTLDEQRTTTLIWAVSALCVVAGMNAFKHVKPRAIRKVLFSGEVMPMKHLNRWREYYPDAMFVNLYGPTESTGNCMYYIVDREFGLDETLPLGKTFDNVEVLLLDEDDRLVEGEGEGEICIRGACVALGYYRDPERTAASFVQNPLNANYPDILYRTGDIARIDADGEMRFASRKDFQIKHMGHRIELEEIELHLNSIEGINRSCCIFDTQANKIVAFYEGSPEAPDIVKGLGKKLPKYMIPNRFESVESIPVSKNGKVDRAKLRALLAEGR